MVVPRVDKRSPTTRATTTTTTTKSLQSKSKSSPSSQSPTSTTSISSLFCGAFISTNNNNNQHQTHPSACGFGEPFVDNCHTMFGIDFTNPFGATNNNNNNNKKGDDDGDDGIVETDTTTVATEQTDESPKSKPDDKQTDAEPKPKTKKKKQDTKKEGEEAPSSPVKEKKKKKSITTTPSTPKSPGEKKKSSKTLLKSPEKKEKTKKLKSPKKEKKEKKKVNVDNDSDNDDHDKAEEDDVFNMLDDLEIPDFNMSEDNLDAGNAIDEEKQQEQEKVVDWNKRMARDEVFSKRYRPNKVEEKELTNVADELGIVASGGGGGGMFGMGNLRASLAVAITGVEDSPHISTLLHGGHSIILKRGPKLKGTTIITSTTPPPPTAAATTADKSDDKNDKKETEKKEIKKETKTVELILLTEGFILTLPDYNRLNPLERRYEAAHLWSEVDFCHKVNKSTFAIQLLTGERFELQTLTEQNDDDDNKKNNNAFGAADNDNDDNDVKSWFKALERIIIEHSMHQGRPDTYPDALGWQYRLIRTPGYSAAVTGNPDIVGKPKNLNKLDKYNKMAPLHYALQVQHEQQPQQQPDQDDGGQSSSSSSPSISTVKVVKALLKKGADPNFPDEDGRCAMYYAERNKLVEIKKVLESNGGEASKLAEMEERGALFGSAEQAGRNTERRREREKVMKENEQAVKDKKAAEASAKADSAQSEMSKAMSALIERGEKIQQLDDKTKDLESEAKNFADLASKLKEKTMKKKWYQL